MRINYKLITIGLLFFLLYLGGSYLYLTNRLDTLHDEKYAEYSKRMHRAADVYVREKLEAITLVGTVVAQNKDVKNLLLRKNAPELQLNKYSEIVKEHTSLKSIWFQVIDKDGVSRYRSWTKEKGDSLLKIRKDLAKMIENPKLSAVISTGKFGMTFKSMVPIYHNEAFIGSVETISFFSSVVFKLEKENFHSLVLVDKKYKTQLTRAINNNFIDSYYVSAFSGSKKMMRGVLEKGVDPFTKIEGHYFDTKNKQLFSLYRILDVHGKEMGYMILAVDFVDMDMSNIENSKKRIVLGLLVGFLLIIGFLIYLYMVNYKNYIEEQRQKLEESVREKTYELRIKSEEMSHLAHHDSLTNLPNRLLFEVTLQDAIESAKKHNQSVGVLFLDLDGFKEINDTYGHKTGDSLLKSITKRLKKALRGDNTVARLGGDEFTVIIQNSSVEVLEKIAEKIIRETQEPVIVEDIELFVTFSVGISVYPEDGETTELLLKHADTAMYRAKENGKNRYQFYNWRMTEITSEKVALQNALREAISLGQFEPYYQPKIDARSGKVVGLEALVRWNHPQRGIVPPMEFIPLAEESGLIKEIDVFMLHATLKQMRLWHIEEIETGKVSVNLSTKQLQDFVCVESFREALERYGVDSKYLEVEVTESQIMKNQKESMAVLSQLQALGISISMDDFGTGYSSLSYLKNLPVDKLKIDRSFIMETPNDADDVALVKTIITLAKNLGLDIIAEGVETQEQVDFLVEEGCYEIQGYHYSKPLSAKECKAFLMART